MEVAKGYKQTEVGVIPEDWDECTIQDLIDRKAILGHLDGNHGELYPRSDEFSTYGVPYVTANDLTGHEVSFAKCKFLPEKRAEKFRKGIAKDGDVLFAHNATVGPTALLSTNLDYVILSTTATYFRCSPDVLSNKFFLYQLQSPLFIPQYTAVMSQSTRNQVPIGAQRKLHVALPPTKAEQEAIAEALSDADSLIESLQQLIAKKRHIKQGAMQELLRPKDDWVEKTLGELGFTYGGLTGKTKADFGDGTSSYITFMNVMSNVLIDCDTFEKVEISPTETQNRTKKGDLFFNGSSETPEELAVCAVLLDEVEDVYLNSFCFGFRLREQVESDGVFLAYYLRSDIGRELMKSLAQGSTRYNLSKSAFLKSSLLMPLFTEQTAIATILSDMDEEITALESKLNKARQLKQGMMHNLLTGKIRLI